MKIEIRSQHFELSEDMTSQIINRVRFALSRFGGEIGHVQVHFTDTNGSKGGLHKHCSLSVKLASLGKIVTKGDGIDLLSTLNCCADRAERATHRKLERGRNTPIKKNRRRNYEWTI